MKKITAIVVQKKNPNRVNLYLDGEFAFGLARITAAWLKNGEELSDERIAQLLNEDTREWAYQQALLFLSYRARSEKEIRQNLLKHEVSEEIAEETLARLRKAGLANDNKFAQAWVENRNLFRPRSKRALTVELRQKGLDDEAINASLSNVDEEALAYAAAQKRAARFKDLEWVEFRKKISEFLARRGFSYSVIAPTVSKIWSETRADALPYEDEDTP
ncbi:MAG: RecX family transcriptional regulator [Anaerolineales bacterium]|nr:RecX family transcriptional regulator [Anaerolineales bacterium]